MTRLRPLAAGLALLLAGASAARALDALVDKRTATIRSFAFESGETVPELELGVETYGTLASSGDNVVLVSTYFAGDSHAAGRYAASDPEAGWWDGLIGSGEPIDTDRWFVVCMDLISSMDVKDPRVVTTGPATTNPRTGERWGLDFPEVTVRDQVRAQRAVLDALGVRHLRAVTGPSLGGMAAWQWAVDAPSLVDVIVPVAGPPTSSAVDRAGYRSAAATVRSDPYWMLGDYHRYGVEPVYGVAMALSGLNAIVRGEGLSFLFGLPARLEEARGFDANHYLRFLDMHEEYGLDHDYGSLEAAFARIRARVAVVGFDDDDFVTADDLQETADALAAAGVRHRVEVVPGDHGHLSALHDPDAFAGVLRDAVEGRSPRTR